ncbi:MAG TPA: preprotein translocase subunit SecE [Candidatus Omnitrophica bacterium]|nr:preprotein translocase subunit SecE [Candidatus Omnitrophota bacterium]HBG63917.1 preprotein translocase subunit SecE [Candidatus Omnitrophota bacterium]HCD37899.1 preprotein translocase subunit SecE [Candidatus Omnitrophota bacterium]
MDFLMHNIGKILCALIGIMLAVAGIKNYKKIKVFLSEVKVELSKVSWSTRHELFGATSVVISATFILALYIGIVDFSLSRLLTVLIK